MVVLKTIENGRGFSRKWAWFLEFRAQEFNRTPLQQILDPPLTFEVDFPSEEEKALFSERVESVWQKMEGLGGGHRLSKLELLFRLFIDIIYGLLAIAEAFLLPGTETSQAPRETRPERLMNTRADVESK